jgi:hypothetical protein
MAISNGFWSLDLSVESLVLRENACTKGFVFVLSMSSVVRKQIQAKSDRPTSLLFSFDCGPSAMRVGFGHDRARGHLQLAVGSSFAS